MGTRADLQQSAAAYSNTLVGRYGERPVAANLPYSKPVQGFRISPYQQELMAVAGVRGAYAVSNELLEKPLGIRISASSIYSAMEATAKTLNEEALYLPISYATVYAQVDGCVLLIDQGCRCHAGKR